MLNDCKGLGIPVYRIFGDFTRHFYVSLTGHVALTWHVRGNDVALRSRYVGITWHYVALCGRYVGITW
jgi:hypothetical protein